MMSSINAVNNACLGAVHPMFKPEEGRGKVVDINCRDARQLVVTSTGKIIMIPVMLGSSTKVVALKDGTYAVTTKGSYLGAEPKTTIMTEEELIEKFGKFNNKGPVKFSTVA